MIVRLSLLLVLTALAVLARPVNAADPVTARILDVDDSAYPDLKALVTVVDAGGRPLQSLPTGAFAAQESGRPATISAVETVLDNQIGVGVVLTMDTSGSMLGPPITQAKAAAGAFVRALQPADQTAVLSFAGQVTVQDRLSADRNTALLALDGLAAVGDTALFDAVAESLRVASTMPLPRKAVVLLTDGGLAGEVSTTSSQQALALAGQAAIPVYSIGVGTEINRPFLQELSRVTGGTFLEAPTPAAIPALYTQLSQLLRSQYVVTLRSIAPAELSDRSLTLTVTTTAGTAQTRFDYKTRRTVAPQEAAAPPPEVPAAAAVETRGSGAGSSVLLFLAVVVAALGVGGGIFAGKSWLRQRRLATTLATNTTRAAGLLAAGWPAALAPPATTDAGKKKLRLVVIGPDETIEYDIDEVPAIIGSGSDCRIRLDAPADVVAQEYARVWARDGKLVLHQLAKTPANSPTSWTTLEAGEEVQIGAFRLGVEAI